jgi:hypothetical protein
MKNIPIHVCAKTAFVGWPPTEYRRISSLRNFLSYNHYFTEYFKWVCRKNAVMVNFTTGIMLILYICMHFWVWGILRRWSACADRLWSGPRLPKGWETRVIPPSLNYFVLPETVAFLSCLLSLLPYTQPNALTLHGIMNSYTAPVS